MATTTVINNINKIVWTKNSLKSLLKTLGMNPNDDFRTYKYLFLDKLSEINNKSDDILGL